MSQSLSPLGKAVAESVHARTGRRLTIVRHDILGLILEQTAAAQTTDATPDVVTEIIDRHRELKTVSLVGDELPSIAEALACEAVLETKGQPPFVVPGVRIPLAHHTDFEAEGWLTLLELFDAMPRDWALVGGQMVHLHCWQRGVTPPRVTTDADVILDVRLRKSALATATAFLRERGFDEDGRSPTEVAHRWKRGRVSIDVLLPEGIGERVAQARTVTGGRTVQVPGGTQALARAQRVEVEVAGRTGYVIRPSLLGALVGKAAALEIPVDPNRERHREDFITLAGLIDNPAGMNQIVDKKDRQRAERMLAWAPDSYPGWDQAEHGVATRGTAVMSFGIRPPN
ncbi:MAG: hypothetical protein Q7L55_11840 [Actinomycetota bacterium]|nr:hypothetical protein [Actinomycetota bacterium]